MQCLFLMGLMTVLWALYGYSLAFGGNDEGENRLIGNGQYLFMHEVARSWDAATNTPIEPMEGSIPRLTHMLFQGMFFIITPALICGAFAERMKFSSMILFSILWGDVCLLPLVSLGVGWRDPRFWRQGGDCRWRTRFCWRDRGAYQCRSFGPVVCCDDWPP